MPDSTVIAALAAPDSSTRLQAALAAGTHPDDGYIDPLLERCAVEPDFFVRDMLTWALTRQDRALTVPPVLAATAAPETQARSQALHTLSKLGDPRGWSAITPELLRDPDDEIARAAWRAAVALVPAGEEPALAATLATQLGRGDRAVQLSLSQAIAALGDAADAVLEAATQHPDEGVRTHALATAHIIADPDAGFDSAVHEARRLSALKDAPMIDPGIAGT